VVGKIAIDQLPGLPHVLIEILDAISSDKADYKGIASTVRHETAVVAKLISAANSSIFGNSKPCDSIERALLFLGTDAVKTIVITTSIQQYFADFSLQHDQFLKTFWRRSLITANVAKVLATLTSYPNPDEAYLCGLLTNVGQLILLTSHGDRYLELLASSDSDEQLLEREMQEFSTRYCDLSAELIESWNIPGFMADASRYQQEPVATLLDAHHLVKIINLSTRLSSHPNISEQTFSAADTLFGLNESLTGELLSRINNDADNMASALGIDTGPAPVRVKLGKRLASIAELANISAELWQASNQESLQTAINRALFLTFGINENLLFLYDSQQNLLNGQADKNPQTSNQNFTVPAIAGRSLISESLLARRPITSQDQSQPLNIIDRQLLRYLDSSYLICWPLLSDNNPIGVLVLGVSDHQLQIFEQKPNLSGALASEIAAVIDSSTRRLSEMEANNDSSTDYRDKIGEAVHEASNPLSIIRNYLELLSVKLGDGHSAEGEITIIKEEIDRVGNILLRLKEPEREHSTGPIDINPLIESISHIFSSSLCVAKQIALNINLDPLVTSIEGNSEHLKQIVTNLLKNAVEALPVSGQINISTEASISFGSRQFVGITIEDNGPGIDEDIKKQLFSPVGSTKGSSHSGLGLSIVKKLLDEMGGSIVCRSNAKSGTQFQILLPEPG